MDTMTIAIKEYFNGFFDDVKFYMSPGRGLPNLAFDGTRNGDVYSFLVPPNMYEGEMLFHWLENIKGDITNNEQKMVLDKAYATIDIVVKECVEDIKNTRRRFSKMPVTFSDEQINRIKELNDKK